MDGRRHVTVMSKDAPLVAKLVNLWDKGSFLSRFVSATGPMYEEQLPVRNATIDRPIGFFFQLHPAESARFAKPIMVKTLRKSSMHSASLCFSLLTTFCSPLRLLAYDDAHIGPSLNEHKFSCN